MKRLTIIILLAAAAGMVSCSAVRHCKAPDVDLPERIAGEDSDSLTVADVQWWRFYGDSTLCRIIERTLDNNRDMLAAAARVERLRELYRLHRQEMLPGYDVIAVARMRAVDMPYAKLEKQYLRCLAQLGLLREDV